MEREFVRVNLEGSSLYGAVCEVHGRDAEGLLHVQGMGTLSFVSSWMRPDDVQPIQYGTRVLVEVSIVNLRDGSMLIPGGWMSLDRIREVVSQPAVAEPNPPFTGDPFLDYPEDLP